MFLTVPRRSLPCTGPLIMRTRSISSLVWLPRWPRWDTRAYLVAISTCCVPLQIKLLRTFLGPRPHLSMNSLVMQPCGKWPVRERDTLGIIIKLPRFALFSIVSSCVRTGMCSSLCLLFWLSPLLDPTTPHCCLILVVLSLDLGPVSALILLGSSARVLPPGDIKDCFPSPH